RKKNGQVLEPHAIDVLELKKLVSECNVKLMPSDRFRSLRQDRSESLIGGHRNIQFWIDRVNHTGGGCGQRQIADLTADGLVQKGEILRASLRQIQLVWDQADQFSRRGATRGTVDLSQHSGALSQDD